MSAQTHYKVVDDLCMLVYEVCHRLYATYAFLLLNSFHRHSQDLQLRPLNHCKWPFPRADQCDESDVAGDQKAFHFPDALGGSGVRWRRRRTLEASPVTSPRIASYHATSVMA
jgi:hypothetical protein